MPGSSSKRSTMTAARLVFVKGLSSSTSHRSHTGQGTDRRAGTNAPDDADETDEADQAKKDVRDRCHGLACLAYVRLCLMHSCRGRQRS